MKHLLKTGRRQGSKDYLMLQLMVEDAAQADF